MDVLHPRCCGLDVHKSSISACILLREAGRVQKHQRRFGAMTQDLRELGEWLRQFGVTHVAITTSSTCCAISPFRKESQLLWAAAVTHPFKLVLAIDFHIADDHSQHLLMYVNSRYPIRHRVPPGGSGERATTSLTRVTGCRRSHRRGETTPNYSLNHARSGSDTRTALNSPVRTQSRRSEPVLFCT